MYHQTLFYLIATIHSRHIRSLNLYKCTGPQKRLSTRLNFVMVIDSRLSIKLVVFFLSILCQTLRYLWQYIYNCSLNIPKLFDEIYIQCRRCIYFNLFYYYIFRKDFKEAIVLFIVLGNVYLEDFIYKCVQKN